ncbi:small-conductance mechanosensitive channel [Belliella baltica DSM 15883]|uniref:Small-conductance mechanosensitive channel n=1 Tax=Belliella baltica (strain DSM 15883 / CIP 108006 / LMG 21964 / BA134) TaxID=866536 RepID=I3Z413_BELBD|nr:mechanosensitive ion channel domain-containing protein [Belliella baltica]AFL83981.1 small-conductance mechanosensitive channel [Belliella baltica DSM 15883]
MNFKKSAVQVVENEKRKIFLIKLVVFLVLVILIPIVPFLNDFIFSNSFMYQFYSSLIFLFGANLIISLGRIIAAKFYIRRIAEQRIHGNFLLGITWISNILNVIAFLIAFMFLFAIKPLEFLTSLTIVAAAIAILSKDYVTNMINGLIIMFTNQFSLGDQIKIGEHFGRLSDITLLNLVLKNDNEDSIIIPNNLVFAAQVVNQNPFRKKVQVYFEVPLGTVISTQEVENEISSYLLDQGEDVAEMELSVSLAELLKDCKKFEIKAFDKPNNAQKLEKLLKEGILKFIDEIKK